MMDIGDIAIIAAVIGSIAFVLSPLVVVPVAALYFWAKEVLGRGH